MLRRTSAGCVATSNPATVAVPEVGVRSVVSILRVVVLPAPFGPRNPTISPFSTSRSTPATAFTSTFSRPLRAWKLRASPRAWIMLSP